MSNFDALLLEIQDSKTESSRLWEIKDSELSSADLSNASGLITALADHPNAEDDLCFELVRDWPREALASTRLRLLLLAHDDIPWNGIFEDFLTILPALPALVDITSAHSTIVSLFEAQLLRKYDDLECSFDWNMTCVQKVTVDWHPDPEVDAGEVGGCHSDGAYQSFAIALTATIDSGNSASLRSPNQILDIRQLVSDLNSIGTSDNLVGILLNYGWQLDTNYTGDGGYFEIESVEPDLVDWDWSSASIAGNCSGFIAVTDPSGVEHNIKLPPGEIEDSFDNYRIDNEVDLVESVFEGDQDALNALTCILGL